MKQVSFRSIPTAVDFSMLAHSSHSNNVINIFSKMLNTQNMASLSRDKYNHIKKPNKYDKNSIVG